MSGQIPQVPQGVGLPVGGGRRAMGGWMRGVQWASRRARILAPLLTLLSMVVFFGLVTDVFLTVNNLRNVVSQIGVTAVAATGITFVLLCAEIDLSIASVATLAGVLAAYFWVDTRFGLGAWGIAVALLITVLLGLLNGFLVAYVGIPSFMMTLAMLTIGLGFSIWVTQGKPIFQVPDVLRSLGSVGNQFLGVPVIGWFALGVLLIGELVLGYTRFGRYVYMTGANREAAEMSGIDTRRVVMLCLTISAFTAGMAGMLFVGRLSSANPSAGGDLLISTIAAVVLGGTSLFGGEGGIKNTILGLLIFGVLSNGLNLLPNLDYNFKQALQGIILVAALLLNVAALRLERMRVQAE